MIVGELAWIVNKSPAIVVTGPNGALVEVERFPKSLVAQVGGVEDEPQPVHFTQQFPTLLGKRPDLIVTKGVAPLAVMGGTQGAQALFMGSFEISEGAEGIGSLEA